jgi:molecular chaperone HtpG
VDGSSVERLELHLPGLLQLLGESLYSDPRVAYRELVQNAHDACVRRDLAGDASYVPRIDVAVRREAGRTLVAITDNGEGLDADDIRTFLATIGRGRTGELRALLEAEGTTDHERLVGQFGVGLLSAFLVADRLEVLTRRGDRAEGYRWICEGKQTYRLEPAQRAAQGSEVLLRIREDRAELGDADVIRDAIAHYARYLAVPIDVAGEVVNLRTLPWAPLQGRPRVAIDELAQDWCRFGAPLATIELQPFTDPGLGPIALHGVLVIPEGSHLSMHELGELAVVIRQMVITTHDRELMPPWAKFVTGLVDCPALEPTASREQVRRGPALVAVQRELARQLLAGIADIQQRTPEVWRSILDGHGSVLKTWGARFTELFDAVADHVTYRTTRGVSTLPAYLEEIGEDALYFFDDAEEARSMTLLLESTERPVLDARWAGDVQFLHAFARERSVKLIRQSEAEANVIAELPDPAPGLRRLAGWIADPELDVKIARYAPTSLPAFVRVPPRIETQGRARRALADEQVHSAMRDLLAAYADAAPPPDHRRTLFVNADNPLVQHLAATDTEEARAVATVIASMARMVSGETLAPSALLDAYRAAVTSLGTLIGHSDRAITARPIPPEWASRRAGLSPKHARLLAANFPTFPSLVDASRDAIAKVLGLPPMIADALQALAKEDA